MEDIQEDGVVSIKGVRFQSLPRHLVNLGSRMVSRTELLYQIRWPSHEQETLLSREYIDVQAKHSL